MKAFLAKNPKQLDICLKLLYAEKVGFTVAVTENRKRKIEYLITALTDDKTIGMLLEKYRILIS